MWDTLVRGNRHPSGEEERHYNHLLKDSHTQLNSRIPILNVERLVVRKVDEEAVKQAHRQKGKRGEDGEEQALFGGGESPHRGRGQDCEADQGEKDDEEEYAACFLEVLPRAVF